MLAIGTTCVVFHEREDGFDEKERDASGHWLARSSTEEDAKPPPPIAMHAVRVARGSAPCNYAFAVASLASCAVP